MKNCSKCKVTKSKKEFSKKSSNKDGLRYWCKDCSKVSIKNWRNKNKKHIDNYSKKYQQENKELIKERKINYRVNNKQKIKTYNKKYKQENKNRIKNTRKIYRLKNIIKIKEDEKIRGKTYRKNNPEKINDYLKKYRIENKEKIGENQKTRRLKHLKKNPNYYKDYQIKNSVKLKENSDRYYLDNKEKIKVRAKKYAKEHRKKINKRIAYRYKNDIQFHLNKKLKTYFHKSLKNNSKNGRMIDYLGMTIAEFKNYLESNFENWMTWENRGLYNGNFKYGWDIDHIKPLCLFDLSIEEQVKKAWHYSNLQPLCSKINREIKRDNYEN
jgi:hypothetical protein